MLTSRSWLMIWVPSHLPLFSFIFFTYYLYNICIYTYKYTYIYIYIYIYIYMYTYIYVYIYIYVYVAPSFWVFMFLYWDILFLQFYGPYLANPSMVSFWDACLSPSHPCSVPDLSWQHWWLAWQHGAFIWHSPVSSNMACWKMDHRNSWCSYWNPKFRSWISQLATFDDTSQTWRAGNPLFIADVLIKP